MYKKNPQHPDIHFIEHWLGEENTTEMEIKQFCYDVDNKSVYASHMNKNRCFIHQVQVKHISIA